MFLVVTFPQSLDKVLFDNVIAILANREICSVMGLTEELVTTK